MPSKKSVPASQDETPTRVISSGAQACGCDILVLEKAGVLSLVVQQGKRCSLLHELSDTSLTPGWSIVSRERASLDGKQDSDG